MPELFIELFSEEVPARLQSRGADELRRLVGEGLSAIAPSDVRTFCGPRRIALAAEVSAEVAAVSSVERGPREGAPDQAVAGFLRKHGASREALRLDGGFWVLERITSSERADALVARVMPGLLWRFAWPKSMRWGGTSGFTWVRPLRRITCLLDGEVVPFALAQGGDDGHGLRSGNLTEGHRLHAPGPVAVSGLEDWRSTLFERRVMIEGRLTAVREGLPRLAAEHGLSIVEDDGLAREVAGLFEWFVPLLGRIDDAFMDLPKEVMQVSMRVNQRYFATRTADGAPAPWFAFVANVDAPDGGAAIVAGNERVLRARFADARHFWDLDRRVKLADRVAALDGVTFQAELGSQGARTRRLVRLAGVIAPLVGADPALAERAALLCKADLTTGMVGEFPELQGVMGGYYARHDGEERRVERAIRDHYLPQRADDHIPAASVTVALALADRLDQLAGFFTVGKKPTGSGDPFALRRAALGITRIIQQYRPRLDMRGILVMAAEGFSGSIIGNSRDPEIVADEVYRFVIERLRVQLRADGARYDVLNAALSTKTEDLVAALALADAMEAFLGTPDGRNLLTAYRRATNILLIEQRKDGPYDTVIDQTQFVQPEERILYDTLQDTNRSLQHLLSSESYTEAMSKLAQLREPLDAFFERVTVNSEHPTLRRNRLQLLSLLRWSLARVADFSTIES